MAKDAKRLMDFVDGIQGTYVDTVKEGVQADDPNLDNACKIEYIPDTHVFKAFRRSMAMLFGRKPTVLTNRVYPESAIKHKTFQSDEEGVPEKVVYILEDQHGNAPVLEAVGREHEQSIAKAEKEKSSSEKQKTHQEIQQMEQNDEDKRSEREPSAPRGSRRRNDERGIGDMF